MLGQYLPLLALIALATLFAAASFVMSGLLAPRNPSVAKRAAYECGIVPTVGAPERFPVRFFLVAMIFIVFDIEIVFFYPYAIAYGGLGIFGLVVIMIFSFAVFESFVYLIGNGALEWGPIKQRPATSGAVSPLRTAETTIRRVGLEDREPVGEDPVGERAGEDSVGERAGEDSVGERAGEDAVVVGAP